MKVIEVDKGVDVSFNLEDMDEDTYVMVLTEQRLKEIVSGAALFSALVGALVVAVIEAAVLIFSLGGN